MNQSMKQQWNIQRNWLEIDVDAAWHNAHHLRSSLPRETKIMAVVKDNAYGHGAYPLVRAFEEAGVDQFAVSTIDEGVALREHGIGAPILILSPVSLRSFDFLVHYELMPTIATKDFARGLSAKAKQEGVKIPFHLKLNVGMNRFGLRVRDSGSLAEADEILSLDNLKCAGTFTHLPSADDPASDELTRQQVTDFTRFCHELEKMGHRLGLRHVANSATVLRFPEYAFDMVRPGILLYGVLPDHCEAQRANYRPLMRWKAEIVQLTEISAGEGVGYNLRWENPGPGPAQIAVLGVGYGDGYQRIYSPGAKVSSPLEDLSLEKLMNFQSADGGAGDRCAEVVGNVCMDATMVRLPAHPLARELFSYGSEVTIMGGEGGASSVEDLAKLAGTIPYEVMTNIAKRVPRVYFSHGRPFLRSLSAFVYGRPD